METSNDLQGQTPAHIFRSCWATLLLCTFLIWRLPMPEKGICPKCEDELKWRQGANSSTWKSKIFAKLSARLYLYQWFCSAVVLQCRMWVTLWKKVSCVSHVTAKQYENICYLEGNESVFHSLLSSVTQVVTQPLNMCTHPEVCIKFVNAYAYIYRSIYMEEKKSGALQCWPGRVRW